MRQTMLTEHFRNTTNIMPVAEFPKPDDLVQEKVQNQVVKPDVDEQNVSLTEAAQVKVAPNDVDVEHKVNVTPTEYENQRKKVSELCRLLTSNKVCARLSNPPFDFLCASWFLLIVCSY